MKIRILFASVVSFIILLGACQSQPEYCTVKGTIKGVNEGEKLQLMDAFDHFKVIDTVRVKNGAFEFHPHISVPTHAYLYTEQGMQLKDFLLEPGTIIANVDATDEEDYATHATGTPSNDLLVKIRELYRSGDADAATALRDEVMNAKETGVLALYYADGHGATAVQGLSALNRLSPDIAAKPFIAELRDELTRRAKTEPAPEGSGSANYFIDLEFPDVDGNVISLSSVVNNPANRYVILDFWATWCEPCRESIPELKALYDKYHEKGLEIYSVSEDQNEENWKSFLPESGMTWINVRDVNPGRQDDNAWAKYALHGIPTTLLLDGETGEILLRDDLQNIDTFISPLMQ
ncbi:MAG: AhpC/TSA family protein [Prevotella sp.]|nr:AhpC/TSA family protein [Prevotella sp.]